MSERVQTRRCSGPSSKYRLSSYVRAGVVQALRSNFLNGQPVRLIRGPKLPGPHSTAASGGGFRYDGLYRVTKVRETIASTAVLLHSALTLIDISMGNLRGCQHVTEPAFPGGDGGDWGTAAADVHVHAAAAWGRSGGLGGRRAAEAPGGRQWRPGEGREEDQESWGPKYLVTQPRCYGHAVQS